MQSSSLPIIEVNHGIANNFGTHIEINKNLRKYPGLEPILARMNNRKKSQLLLKKKLRR